MNNHFEKRKKALQLFIKFNEQMEELGLTPKDCVFDMQAFINHHSTAVPRTELGGIIKTRIRNKNSDYRIDENDIAWLDLCNAYWDKEFTNESFFKAIQKAYEIHREDVHCDPYELIIDAGIIDKDLNIL